MKKEGDCYNGNRPLFGSVKWPNIKDVPVAGQGLPVLVSA